MLDEQIEALEKQVETKKKEDLVQVEDELEQALKAQREMVRK